MSAQRLAFTLATRKIFCQSIDDGTVLCGQIDAAEDKYAAAKTAAVEGISTKAETKVLTALTQYADEMSDAADALKTVTDKVTAMTDECAKAHAFHDEVIPAMDALRAAADKAEEIIDEECFLAALKERTDVRYATDIEPDMHEEYQKELQDRYLATAKKMGAQTAEANINAGLAAANQIVGFIKDGCETFRVN